MSEEIFTVAYDLMLKQPGCALLQATLGATIPNAELARMDRWLLFPTDDLKVYSVTRQELEQLIRVTNA